MKNQRLNHRKTVSVLLAAVVVLQCLLLTGCGSSGKTVNVAYDNTAEEAIIANMMKYLIEKDTDITVNLTGDYPSGGTVMHPAMLKGDIDMYPEYTGTAWLNLLHHTDIPESETLRKQLFEEYKEQFDIEWVGLYGFNSAFGIAVRDDIAEEYELKTISDLARVSKTLRFGAEGSFFERPDGYDGLCEKYGLAFSEASDITFSLRYDAVKDGQVDVIDVWLTDAYIADSNIVVLEDDLNFFTEYLAGTVVRGEVLREYPELEPVLMKLDGLISDEEMIELNREVILAGQEVQETALNFLMKKGLY